MSVLLLKISGPMQAWGDSSRFNHRSTVKAPTKSGILGMVAAAQGRRRTDPVEDLVQLRFGVRIDQPGTVLRDFQTTIDHTGKSKPLSYRSYLADAVFVAGLEGERSTLERLDAAIRQPKYPLFLGRRSCPPDAPLSLGIREEELVSTLKSEMWHASDWFKQRQIDSIGYRATIQCDAVTSSAGEVPILSRDVPVSWDPDHREFGWREVTECSIQLAKSQYDEVHNPFELGKES